MEKNITNKQKIKRLTLIIENEQLELNRLRKKYEIKELKISAYQEMIKALEKSQPNEESKIYSSYHDNGQVKERYYKNENGEKDGLYDMWDDEGKIKVKSTYTNGQLHGLCEIWYGNGQLSERFNYKDGKRNGLCEIWWEDGTQVEKSYYIDNEKVTEKEWEEYNDQ